MAVALRPSQNEFIQSAYADAKQLFAQGASKLQIEKALVEQGVNPRLAGDIVEHLTLSRRSATMQRARQPKLIRAAAAFWVGVILLLLSTLMPGHNMVIVTGIAATVGGLLMLVDAWR